MPVSDVNHEVKYGKKIYDAPLPLQLIGQVAFDTHVEFVLSVVGALKELFY